MTDTLRSIVEGMEHRTVSGCSIPQWSELVARGLTHLDHDENRCPKCRLEALLAEYEKVDLVKEWREPNVNVRCDENGGSVSYDTSYDATRLQCAAELETWLAVNLERIKREAEKKWRFLANELHWLAKWQHEGRDPGHCNPNTEDCPHHACKRATAAIAALEAQAKEKP